MEYILRFLEYIANFVKEFEIGSETDYLRRCVRESLRLSILEGFDLLSIRIMNLSLLGVEIFHLICKSYNKIFTVNSEHNNYVSNFLDYLH